MPETASSRGPSFLVFSDDWGRHPSSCQHLIRQLVPRYPVCWVNTIGTRQPRFDLATLRRGAGTLWRWTTFSDRRRTTPPNLRVVSPRMWPWFSTRRDRWINRRLLLQQLGPWVRSLESPVVAVTTLPIVADLVGCLPVDRWIYYCVDDFGEWPGLDQSALREMESELIPKVDDLIVVSEHLKEKFAARRSPIHLLTHGVDLEHWAPGGCRPPARLPLKDLPRPLVVFWGVIDRRMNVEFVRRLGADLDGGSIVLVGPESDPDPALVRGQHVVRLGPVPYEQLPALADEAAVLIMPYADLPVTRAMQPLKLKEYLATGKPVVTSELPTTRPWADCMDVAETARDFSALVRLRLAEGLSEAQHQGRQRLGDEAWSAKARQFERIAFSSKVLPT